MLVVAELLVPAKVSFVLLKIFHRDDFISIWGTSEIRSNVDNDDVLCCSFVRFLLFCLVPSIRRRLFAFRFWDFGVLLLISFCRHMPACHEYKLSFHSS